MKKNRPGIANSAAEVSLGSPSASGVDVSRLYIDMLCEKFRDRGIKTGLARDAERQRERDVIYAASSGGVSPRIVSAYDEKYRVVDQSGLSYMTSDGFAEYYRDLRNYKTPVSVSRAESEYEAALAENVQESGKPPKKALWLAAARRVKQGLKGLPSLLSRKKLEELAQEWFPPDSASERVEGKKVRIPRSYLSTLAILTVSLLLIVSSSVAVSRASADVASHKEELDALYEQRSDLESRLEVKNDMLDIYDIAVNEYGMISAEYAASRYVDVTEEGRMESVPVEEDGGFFARLLRAIGLKD